MSERKFYTYAFLRDDGSPYYVGKGHGSRAYDRHWRARKRDEKLTSYFDPPPVHRVLFLKRSLTEQEAFNHEKYMIHVLGRKDHGTGMLRNQTDGGQGRHGSTAWNKGQTGTCPEHQIEANRASMQARYTSGLRMDGEHNPRAKRWRLTFVDGRVIEFSALQSWCTEHGYNRRAMRLLLNGKWKRYRDIQSIQTI
jgi:hypothetical protein